MNQNSKSFVLEKDKFKKKYMKNSNSKPKNFFEDNDKYVETNSKNYSAISHTHNYSVLKESNVSN